jgi:hypothetical protein
MSDVTYFIWNGPTPTPLNNTLGSFTQNISCFERPRSHKTVLLTTCSCGKKA